MKSEKILLIGSDARLSKRLINLIDIKYLTSRQIKKNFLYLELSNFEKFQIPSDVTSAIIVGGPTSYNQSVNEKKSVLNIHKYCLPGLVKNLLIKDIFTIYISSNMVLGDNKERNEYSEPKPIIEYGKFKNICEKEILSFAKKLNKESYIAILRLTKNISCDTTPFDQWIKSYKNDKEIYAFDDLILSPITYEASAEVVLQILKRKVTGILHFSGENDLNYYQLAKQLNKYLISINMKCLNLKKSNSKAKGINLQNIGDITRLNMERTNKLLGIEPFSNMWVFHYFANQLRN